MTLGDRRTPVQHFFPVWYVGYRCRFYQKPGVADIPTGSGYYVMFFAFLRKSEKLNQFSIGVVQQAFGNVVTDVNEPAGQTPHRAIDYGMASRGITALKSDEVNIEYCGHVVYSQFVAVNSEQTTADYRPAYRVIDRRLKSPNKWSATARLLVSSSPRSARQPR